MSGLCQERRPIQDIMRLRKCKEGEQPFAKVISVDKTRNRFTAVTLDGDIIIQGSIDDEIDEVEDDDN